MFVDRKIILKLCEPLRELIQKIEFLAPRSAEKAMVLRCQFIEFIFESLDVAIEEFAAKVDQKSVFQVGQFQVCEHLFFVDPREGSERFQLDKHHSSHNKRRSRALIEASPTKLNGN